MEGISPYFVSDMQKMTIVWSDGMYRIVFEKQAEETVKIAFAESRENEIAILAFADCSGNIITIKEKYCILCEGQTELAAHISPEKQMKLIKYCGENNRIPVVIHSHIYAKRKVYFSSVDLKFEASFHRVQEKLRYPVSTVFIVYGQKQLRTRLCIEGRYKPFEIEDDINHKIFKGTAVWANILKNIRAWYWHLH